MIDHRLITLNLVPMEWLLMPLKGIGGYVEYLPSPGAASMDEAVDAGKARAYNYLPGRCSWMVNFQIMILGSR